ncbi:MAG TPA: hypothetical protein VFO86_09440 [Terriglobia bacterium]|nr:hypothetical protein [Terriglobia bacterium]
MIKWRGQVSSAIRGKRGQNLLTQLLAALDAMPEKRLIREELEQDGEVCTLGALGKVRGIDMTDLDPDDPDGVAAVFDVAPQLVQEIVYMNDEYNEFTYEVVGGRSVRRDISPEQRWKNMRAWVASKINPATETA